MKLIQFTIEKETDIVKKESDIIRDTRHIFTLKRENKAIKDRVIVDIRALFESEEDDYEPIKTKGAFNNNYIDLF